VQHAVIAVAHAQAVFEGFDMDVAGVGFDGAADDLVDQADDGGLAGEIFQSLGILLQTGA
jgi:hypothetical protein